jgi:hypothetical protein
MRNHRPNSFKGNIMQFGNNFGSGNFGNGGNFGGGSSFGSFDSSGSFNGQGNNLQESLTGYNFGSAHAGSDQAGAMTIEIRKVYMGLTRPQGQQHRRSYDVVVDGKGMSAIQEGVERYGVNAFDPTHISGVMASGADFIRPSGTADAAVGIDNGWDVERYRFTMVVDCYRNGRFAKTEFISGYTDHAGVSNAGLISTVQVDPLMVFTINHVTEARQRQMDAQGAPVPLVSRSNGVVRNTSFLGMGNGGNMYMTRPSDVLRAVDKVSLYQGMNQASAFGDSSAQSYQDLDSLLTHVPMCSADTNLLIPTFASRTLKGLYENSLTTFDPMNLDGSGAGALASTRVQDSAFSSSSFVHVMNRKLANHVTVTAQFNYADLMRLDPTIDDRAEVFGRSYETGVISIPDGRSVECLGETTTVAVHATSIVQTTLALMSLSGVATLAYNANNMRTGQTEITIQACDGIDADGMLFQRLEVLKNRLALECLSIVSISDEITYEVDVFADAFNDVFIQLTWDGTRRDYVVPAYASSSLAPVVTNDLSRLVGMAQAIDQVIDVCKNVLNPTVNDNINSGGNIGRSGGLAGDY